MLIAGGIGITPMMAHLRGLYNTRAKGFLKQDRFPDVWLVSRGRLSNPASVASSPPAISPIPALTQPVQDLTPQ